MNKEIKKLIWVFLFAFAVFICAVAVSEIINYRHIVSSYPERVHIAIPNVVTIGMPSQAAFDFQKSKVTTWLIRIFLSFAVPAFFIFSKLSAGIRNWVAQRTRRRILVIVLYFILYSIIETLIYLPLDFYTGFIRMHHYGLSNQNIVQWTVEMLKSFAINVLMFSLILWIPFYIIKKSPRRWWLYIALVSIPYLFFVSYIQPVVIDPIFNQYKQLNDYELTIKIDELLKKTNIGNCQILEVDKSKETTQMNAYMTGVFNTKRIVLWDNTVNNMSNEEVLGVVAHEMGHYLMGHIWKSIVLGGLASIFILYMVYRMCTWFLRKTKGRYGFDSLSDAAALPLIMLMINLMLFITAPVSNAYSRSMEHDADTFELELTQDNFATATGTVKLHQQSLTMPEPGLIYMLWTYDHPTYKSRVDFANTYKPWKEGKALKFQKLIKENTTSK